MSDTPPHVIYDLTPEGLSLAPVLQALYDWGDAWANTHGLEIEQADIATDDT